MQVLHDNVVVDKSGWKTNKKLFYSIKLAAYQDQIKYIDINILYVWH